MASLAVGAAAIVGPQAFAESGSAQGSAVGKGPAVPFDGMPPGAVRSDADLPKHGSYGNTFQKMPSPTSTNRPRVVGGTLADAADYPGVVGIRSTFLWPDEDGTIWQYQTTCTGTVLSPTKVLTAGHCTVDLPFGNTVVIAGRNNLDVNTGGFVARVATAWTHQSFNLAETYEGAAPVDDVSVLTLKDPLPGAYTPVDLSAQGDQSPYAAGTTSTIVGYGVTTPDASDNAGVLHEAEVPMVSNADCASEYGGSFDSSRMVCAGNPTQSIDTCSGDSGGPIFVGGVQVGITDWGYFPCANSYGVYERISFYRSLIDADLARSGLINLDFGGDGHADLFGRRSNGTLEQASGSGLVNDGYGGFSGILPFGGAGWGGYTKIFRTHNWNGDGNPSIMARDSAGGLWQYRTDGKGNLVGGRTQIGTGWNIFTDIMVTNNWMGDGRPNLMGRKANGDLYIYTSNGSGGWLNPRGTKIGVGWNSFNTVLTPGSWLGDGRQSLIGRTKAGDLLLYHSNGSGGFASGRGEKIGVGWNTFKIFMSPGDWGGDNMIDLVGITSAGAMRLYSTNGRGGWLESRGRQISTGWNAYNMVF